MSDLTLRLRQPLAQCIDMSPFIPERLQGKPAGEIARLPIWLGNRRVECGELFAVDGDGADRIVIEAESERLDRLGAGMTGGSIRVEGHAGAYLGYGMRGGSLEVSGNAGLAAGCAMRGGVLSIAGDAGDFLGGAVTGERQGMRGGLLRVRGSAGDRAGDLMRRGIILIEGDCGDYAASRMVAGSLLVLGRCGSHTGWGMRRGSLLSATEPRSLPVTFNDNGLQRLSFLSLLCQTLAEQTGLAELRERGPRVRRWLGDLGCGGKGEILVWS